MTLLVLGINHKTASVAVREKVAFSDEKRQLAFTQIRQQQLADSAVILSTCNRTEIYFHHAKIAPHLITQWQQRAIAWFAQIHQLKLSEIEACIYAVQNHAAATHLMRVACGLDSLILGEPQILGQVKQAFAHSESYYQGDFSTELSRLFQKTFATAKRVRSETQIGENAVSVAFAACALARQIFENLRDLQILLIGAGETIELVCRHLLRHQVKQITIANRTLPRAERLREKLAAPLNICALESLPEALKNADIVISSTASPNLLISREMLQMAEKARKYAPQLLIDIAVPRDIDPRAGELDSVYHYTVDDLQSIIAHNKNQREQAALAAEQIIAQECADFFEWLKVRQFANLIRLYRDEAAQIRAELTEKASQKLAQGESPETVVNELSQKLTNKLLHTPTQTLQTLMKSGNAEGLHAFAQALRLDSN